MIGPDRRLCEDDSRLRLLKKRKKNTNVESVVNIIIYELFETGTRRYSYDYVVSVEYENEAAAIVAIS